MLYNIKKVSYFKKHLYPIIIRARERIKICTIQRIILILHTFFETKLVRNDNKILIIVHFARLILQKSKNKVQEYEKND